MIIKLIKDAFGDIVVEINGYNIVEIQKFGGIYVNGLPIKFTQTLDPETINLKDIFDEMGVDI